MGSLLVRGQPGLHCITMNSWSYCFELTVEADIIICYSAFLIRISLVILIIICIMDTMVEQEMPSDGDLILSYLELKCLCGTKTNTNTKQCEKMKYNMLNVGRPLYRHWVHGLSKSHPWILQCTNSPFAHEVWIFLEHNGIIDPLSNWIVKRSVHCHTGKTIY